MDIAKLRVATRADHKAVEDSLPLMRPDLTRNGYITVLLRLHGIVAAWEEIANESFSGPLKELARERQRLSLLKRDLMFFQATPDESLKPCLSGFHNSAELLGAMYVMEGSRLGGQLIAKHVEEILELDHGSGSSFFRGYGKSTREHWTEFINVLQVHVDDSGTEAVVAGAKKMFREFGDWMRGTPSYTGPSAYEGHPHSMPLIRS